MELSKSARALFSQPIYAWVTVIKPDGTPHNTVVWADLEDDHVLFNTAVGRAKERYLRENPTASLSLINPENPWNWVSVTGTARMSTDDGEEVIDRLAKKYLDADSYPFRKEGEQRVTVRISVDTLLEQ